MRTEIQIELIGDCYNIGDTHEITSRFCIAKADKCLYEDDCSRSWLKPADKGFDHFFRMLDDDGFVYFMGYCKNDSSFAPLDDYGTEYGCTEIQYKVDRKWTTL